MGTFEIELNTLGIMIQLQAYVGREWNMLFGPNRTIGNSTVRRCGLVGVGVAFLEEVGAGFQIPYSSSDT